MGFPKKQNPHHHHHHHQWHNCKLGGGIIGMAGVQVLSMWVKGQRIGIGLRDAGGNSVSAKCGQDSHPLRHVNSRPIDQAE